jgi:endonuclease/exonuclease/phosphatase family metal-dependent hydrolase
MRIRHLAALIGVCGLSFSGVWAQNIRVVTYNIRLDHAGDGPDRWELRKQEVARTLRDFDAAVIGLQEVLPQQVAYLDTALHRYQRYGVGREDGKNRGEYSPVYVDTLRFQLLQQHTLWLSATPDLPGKGWDAACERILTLVLAKNRLRGDTILLANTHWDHVGQTARRESAELLLKTLQEPAWRGYKAIVMGDFNATPDDAPIQRLRSRLADSCPPEQDAAGTFNGFDLQRTQFPRIDYVWYTPGRWERVTYAAPHPLTPAGRHVSDHFPVVVELR